MTDSPNLFISLPDHPLAPARRAEMVGETPWASFRAAALYARKHRARGAADVLDDLERLAGVRAVRDTVDRTFVACGALLRCYRIVQNAEGVLESAEHEYVEGCCKADATARAAGERFLALLDRLAPAALPHDRGTVDELAAFVAQHAGRPSKSGQVAAALAELRQRFAGLRRSLEARSADIATLQLVGDHRAEFSAAEVDEFEALFGGRGIELRQRTGGAADPRAFVRARQAHWQERSRLEAQPVRKQLAAKAAAWYSGLLHDLRAGNHVS